MLLFKVFFFLTSLPESHITFVISLMVLLLMFVSSWIVTCGLNCFGICTIGWLFSTNLLYYIKILAIVLSTISYTLLQCTRFIKKKIQLSIINLYMWYNNEYTDVYMTLYNLAFNLKCSGPFFLPM